MPAAKDVLLRLHEKIVRSEQGCWLIHTSINNQGYAVIWYEGRMQLAHRVAYALYVDDVPAGSVLDHAVCETTNCCNPWHVEPVTQRVNVIRGRSYASDRMHCIRGHAFDRSSSDRCRECARITRREYWQRTGR